MRAQLITRSCLRLLSGGRKVKSPDDANHRGFLELFWAVPSPADLAGILPKITLPFKLLFAQSGTPCCRLTAGHGVNQPDTVGLCTSGKTGQDGSWHFSRGSDELRPSSVEAAATRAPEPLQGSTRVKRLAYVSSFSRGSLAYARTCGIQGQDAIHIQHGQVEEKGAYPG